MRCMTAQRSGAPLFPTYPSARKGAFILLITLVCYTQLCVARGRRFCVSCYNGPGNGLGWFLYFSVGWALKVGSAAHGRFPACGSPGTAGAAPPASWGRWGRGHGHWGLCCPISSGEETRSIPADGHRSPRCISCAGHIILSPCHAVSPSSSMPPTRPQSLQHPPSSPQHPNLSSSPAAGPRDGGEPKDSHYLPSPTCFFSPKHAPVSQAVHHGYSPQQSLSGILAVGCIGKFRAPVLDGFQSSQGVFKAFTPPARGGITSRLTTFYLNIFNHRNGREKKKRINLLLLFSSNTSLVLGAVHILSLCIGDDIYHGCTSFTFFFYIYIFSPAGS